MPFKSIVRTNFCCFCVFDLHLATAIIAVLTAFYGMHIAFGINKPVCHKKSNGTLDDRLSFISPTFGIIFLINGAVVLGISVALGIMTCLINTVPRVKLYVVVIFFTYAHLLLYFFILMGVLLFDQYCLCYRTNYAFYNFHRIWGWESEYITKFDPNVTNDRHCVDSYNILSIVFELLHGLLFIYFAIVVNSYGLQLMDMMSGNYQGPYNFGPVGAGFVRQFTFQFPPPAIRTNPPLQK